MSAKETLIKVENLQKYYKGGAIKALDGINTEIKKGEVVVVIGPSGSGKSTFLRCLNLLEVPTGGHILFEGTDFLDGENAVQHRKEYDRKTQDSCKTQSVTEGETRYEKLSGKR